MLNNDLLKLIHFTYFISLILIQELNLKAFLPSIHRIFIYIMVITLHLIKEIHHLKCISSYFMHNPIAD